MDESAVGRDPSPSAVRLPPAVAMTPPAPASRAGVRLPIAATIRRDALWLLVILAVAAGLRIAWIAVANVNPEDGRVDDTVFYFVTAKWLAAGIGYRDPYWGNYTAGWPPGYPMLLAPLFKLVGPSYVAAKALNVALACAACLLTYELGRRAFDRRTGIAAAFVLALFPGQIFFATLVMTEVAFGAMFLLMLLLLSVWTLDSHQARPWQLITLGLLIGGLALIRAEAVALPLVVIALWRLTMPGWRRLARNAAIMLAAFAIALTPWTVRNAVRLHQFVPLRENSSGALANALDPNYDSRPDKMLPAPSLRDSARYIAHHSWELIPAQLHKVAILYGDDEDGIFWVQNGRPVLETRNADLLSRGASMYFYVVLALALAAAPLWLSIARRRRLVLAFALVTWTLLLSAFWPESRYHFPIVPVLCIFAAALVVTAWDAAARRLRRVAAGRGDTGTLNDADRLGPVLPDSFS